jgi:hypothetical protein
MANYNSYEGDFEYSDSEFDEMEHMDEFEMQDEWGPSTYETDNELALAEELLSADEQEMDQFLGGLLKKGLSGIGRFFKSPRIQQVTQGLVNRIRPIAQSVLPDYGGAIGAQLTQNLGPFGEQCGDYIGRQLGYKGNNWIGNQFAQELQELAPEEQELEIAKRIIRTVKSTANNIAQEVKAGTPPSPALINNVLNKAVKKHLGAAPKKGNGSRIAASGRWVRRGNRIVLLGAFRRDTPNF